MVRSFISKLGLLLSVLIAQVALAQGDHAHDKGPHGGVVTEFGEKHMEVVRSGDTVKFYVLGDDGSSSSSFSKATGGVITVLAPGKKVQKNKIPAGSFNAATVTVPAKGKVTVIVNLKSEGKAITGKFNLKE